MKLILRTMIVLCAFAAFASARAADQAGAERTRLDKPLDTPAGHAEILRGLVRIKGADQGLVAYDDPKVADLFGKGGDGFLEGLRHRRARGRRTAQGRRGRCTDRAIARASPLLTFSRYSP